MIAACAQDYNVRNKHFIIAVVFTYLVMCLAFIIRANSLSSYADAQNYVDIAINFREKGFLSNFDNVKTYGYPAILYAVSYISGLNHSHIKLFSGIAQCALYLGAAVWLAYEVRRSSHTLSYAVLTGLLINIFNITLLVDTMTEAPSLVIAIALAAIVMKSSRAPNLSKLLLWFSAGSALVYFDLMVRPANIVIVLAWTATAAALWWAAPAQKLLLAAVLLSITFVTAAAALAPQIWYNLKYYRFFSPWPGYGIGSRQAEFGIMMMKYGTWVSDQGAGPVIYRNPLYDGGELSGGALHWYVLHPVRGIGTIMLHIFNSFNFDYLFVYIYDLNPVYGMPMTFIVWIMSLLGIWRISTGVVSRRHLSLSLALRRTAIPGVLFSAVLFLGVVVSNGVVAVENRFNLIPTSLLIISAIAYLLRRPGPRKREALVASVFVLTGALLATGLSEWVKTYSEPIMKAKHAAEMLAPTLNLG
jgi:hypothetical protein